MDFQQLIAAAQADLDAADFKALRSAYVLLPGYNPYENRQLSSALADAINAAEWQKAATLGNAALEQDFLFIDLHLALAFVYKNLKLPQQEQWHGRFAGRLINSVFDSGDGLSLATAFQVVHFREIYDVLRVLKLRLTQQALIQHEGQPYDRMDCIAPNGQTVTLFFNISLLHEFLGRQFHSP